MASSSAAGQERVRVFVRKRPPGRGEEQDVTTVSVTPANSEIAVNVAAADAVDTILSGGNPDPGRSGDDAQGIHRFRFDGVFDTGSCQEDVFEQVGLPVLKDVLRGFHGCVMAYGQTGSGKTHSLLNTGGPEQAGLLPRLIAGLFARIGADRGHKHRVRVSALQVYNEQISDLLHPDHAGGGGHGLSVQSNGYVQNATWTPCKDPQDAMKASAEARTNLVYAETKMNKASSRSHAVFQMEVARFAANNSEERKGAKATLGVLTVVDLAGSERVKRSGVAGKQMKEAININGSLLTLGNVVQALASQKKHVPFRDSKLTRLLEPALSGNCRTSLLVCVSPTFESAQETCHALEFASRAMRVEVCAKVHEVDVDVLCNELCQLAVVPMAESVDKELRQKTRDITALEEKLTQAASEAKRWEEKSSQEAKRASDVEGNLRREVQEAERRRQDEARQSAAAVQSMTEGHKVELAKHTQQIADLRAELQTAKVAAGATMTAKEAELCSALAKVTEATQLAERREAEHTQKLADLEEAHRRDLSDVHSQHAQGEGDLRAALEAKSAKLEAALEQAAKQEASAAVQQQAQATEAEDLKSRHAARILDLEEALGRLRVANEASREELEAALKQQQQHGELQAQQLAQQVQRAQEELSESRSQLHTATASWEEERRCASIRCRELEARCKDLERLFLEAKASAESWAAKCKAAEEALCTEQAMGAQARAAAEEALRGAQAASAQASAAETAAAQERHEEEVAALLSAHRSRMSELQAQHSQTLLALKEGHEADRAELQWRLSETEEAFKTLQRRFEVRESRPDDLATLARQRKTIRELSSERKQLGLELQHQLQTDKVFGGGGERKRGQAPIRNCSVGKKLSTMGSFNDRRDEMLGSLSQQRTSSLIEPIC